MRSGYKVLGEFFTILVSEVFSENRGPTLKTHMKFHLHNDDDLTWIKAVDAASRWEASNSKADESESSSSSSSEEEVKIEAMKEKARLLHKYSSLNRQ